MSDDIVTLILCRVKDTNRPAVKGAVVVPCPSCGEPCWIAPSSVQVLDRVETMCLQCAVPLIKQQHAETGEAPEFGGILPGQLDEIKEALEDS